MNMVGTPNSRVTRYCVTAWAAAAAWKRVMTSSVAPADSGTLSTPDMPPLWNMGMAPSATSAPGSKAYQRANCSVLVTMLRCVSMAPLGTPVVPPVYRRTATSCAGTHDTGTSGVQASMAWNVSTAMNGTPRRTAAACPGPPGAPTMSPTLASANCSVTSLSRAAGLAGTTVPPAYQVA